MRIEIFCPFFILFAIRKHLQNYEKSFLFHWRSSFRSRYSQNFVLVFPPLFFPCQPLLNIWDKLIDDKYSGLWRHHFSQLEFKKKKLFDDALLINSNSFLSYWKLQLVVYTNHFIMSWLFYSQLPLSILPGRKL